MKRLIPLAGLASMLATPLAAQEARGLAAPVPLATDGPIAPAEVHRTITLNGGQLPYTATWWEVPLPGEDGRPQATISATSYVREGIVDRAQRPVVVFFNGGPGASSTPLHFSAFGPRRLTSPAAGTERRIEDNPGTLLDTADMLFVDPVGTGFSRPLRDNGGKPYWSPDGDAASVMILVRDWLKRNGREHSPLFIAGESYGGFRAGILAKTAAELNLAGLILISPALDFGMDADQDAIDRLPTMAVAAWKNGKALRSLGSVEQVWDRARVFAQGDYAKALQLGSALPVDQRDRLAKRMADLVGLSSTQIAQANLRVDSQAFLETLVPGSVVGRLDVRVVAPARAKPLNPNRPAAANDPALGLGRTNVITSAPIGEYLRKEIGVNTQRDYFSLTLDVNFNWNWQQPGETPAARWEVLSALSTAMRERPSMRLLVIAGYYDMALPLLGLHYQLTHSRIPQDRARVVAMATGHTPFDGSPASTAIVRDFLTQP